MSLINTSSCLLILIARSGRQGRVFKAKSMWIMFLIIWYLPCLVTIGTSSTARHFKQPPAWTRYKYSDSKNHPAAEKFFTKPKSHTNSQSSISTYSLGSRETIGPSFNHLLFSSDNQQSVENIRLPLLLAIKYWLRIIWSKNSANKIHKEKVSIARKGQENLYETKKDKVKWPLKTKNRLSDDTRKHSISKHISDLNLTIGIENTRLNNLFDDITNLIEKQLDIVFDVGRNREHLNCSDHNTEQMILISTERVLAVTMMRSECEDKTLYNDNGFIRNKSIFNINRGSRTRNRTDHVMRYHEKLQGNVSKRRNGIDTLKSTNNRKFYEDIRRIGKDVMKRGINNYHLVRKRNRCTIICSHCERILHQRWSSLCEIGCQTRNTAFELCRRLMHNTDEDFFPKASKINLESLLKKRSQSYPPDTDNNKHFLRRDRF